jgi:hypothetical protein
MGGGGEVLTRPRCRCSRVGVTVWGYGCRGWPVGGEGIRLKDRVGVDCLLGARSDFVVRCECGPAQVVDD